MSSEGEEVLIEAMGKSVKEVGGMFSGQLTFCFFLFFIAVDLLLLTFLRPLELVFLPLAKDTRPMT